MSNKKYNKKVSSFTSDFIANLTNPLLGLGLDDTFLSETDIDAPAGADEGFFNELCVDPD